MPKILIRLSFDIVQKIFYFDKILLRKNFFVKGLAILKLCDIIHYRW